MLIKIKFNQDVVVDENTTFLAWTEENKQTYTLPMKQAVPFLKTGAAVRFWDKPKGCGCGGKK